MSIAFDTTSTSGFVSPITSVMNWSHIVSGNNRFVMVFGQTEATGGSTYVTGMTYNGETMSSLVGVPVVAPVSSERLWYFYLTNPPVGASSIVVSVETAGHYGQFVAGSYSGVNSNPIDTQGSVTTGTTSASVTGSLTPTIENDWYISGYAFAGAGSTNPTSPNSTRRIIDSTGASTAIFDQGPGSVAGMTMSVVPNITADWQVLLGALVKEFTSANTGKNMNILRNG